MGKVVKNKRGPQNCKIKRNYQKRKDKENKIQAKKTHQSSSLCVAKNKNR